MTVTRVIEHVQDTLVQRNVAFRFLAMVDRSGSMAGGKSRAASEGVQQVMGLAKGNNWVGASSFSTGVEVLLPLGPKRKAVASGALDSAMESMQRCGGRTALWDAIQSGIQQMRESKPSPNVQNELVVVTDGGENSSTSTTFDELKELVAHPGLPNFHLVVLADSPDARLRQLCEPRHCTVLEIGDADSIRGAFGKATTLIRQRMLRVEQVTVHSSRSSRGDIGGAGAGAGAGETASGTRQLLLKAGGAGSGGAKPCAVSSSKGGGGGAKPGRPTKPGYTCKHCEMPSGMLGCHWSENCLKRTK